MKMFCKTQTPLSASNHRKQQKPPRLRPLPLLRNRDNHAPAAQAVGVEPVAGPDHDLAAVRREADDRAGRRAVLEPFTSSTPARPTNLNPSHVRSKLASVMVFQQKCLRA